MSDSRQPVVSSTIPNTALVDPKTGQIQFGWLKWFQQISQVINTSLNQGGTFEGEIGPSATLEGNTTIAALLQNLGPTGEIAFLFVSGVATPTQIGTGVPAAGEYVDGGTGAWTALPVVPTSAAAVPHAWIASYNAATGVFTLTQPDFADLSGAATAAQVPALSALNGQITGTQLPAGGFSGTITTAKLTTLGVNGSMTFTNGQLTAQAQAT